MLASVVFALLAVVMVMFAGAQYNDPDGIFWVLVYLVPAGFSGVTAISRSALASSLGRSVVAACFVAALAGVYAFWPVETEFWHQDVWWQSETAREGMGMMVVSAVLAAVAVAVFSRRTTS